MIDSECACSIQKQFPFVMRTIIKKVKSKIISPICMYYAGVLREARAVNVPLHRETTIVNNINSLNHIKQFFPVHAFRVHVIISQAILNNNPQYYHLHLWNPDLFQKRLRLWHLRFDFGRFFFLNCNLCLYDK